MNRTLGSETRCWCAFNRLQSLDEKAAAISALEREINDFFEALAPVGAVDTV